METAVTTLPAFSPALPEMLLAAGALLLLMYGVFRKDATARDTAYGVLALFAIVCGVLIGQSGGRVATFEGMFVIDAFTFPYKRDTDLG